MKKFILPAILTLFAFGCDNTNETENVHNNHADTIVAPPKEKLGSYSEGFQRLVKSSDGIFRGVNFGMTFSDVKKVEADSQAQEEEKDHLGYMLDYGNLEEAEVNYDFNEQGYLINIEVDVYPKSKESQDSIFYEFEHYFIKRHGNPSESETNTRKWENKEQNLLIVMEKKDTQKVHDITIRITELSREISTLFEQDPIEE